MSKSPFYRVSMAKSGRDITDLIDSFSYEDCTEEDDVVKIVIRGKHPAIIDDPEFSEDVRIRFIFGYLGGDVSPIRVAKITDINYKYGKTVDMTITATDLGRDLKVTESNKIWKNVTSKEIITQIAKKHKMEVNIEGETKKHTNIPQGNSSDFDFIKYLASIEPGNYIYYVKGTTINYVKRKISKAPSYTFIYGDPSGGVLGFNVTVKKDKKNAGSGETKATGINPDTMETVSNKANKTVEKTGRYVYDENSNLITDTDTGKALTGVVVKNPTDAKAVTEKAKANSELEGITASLELEGMPNVAADKILAMNGVAKKHSGNWYISKATHKVDRGGYKTACDLKKNATSQDVSNKDSKEKEANKIYKYDSNADPVK